MSKRAQGLIEYILLVVVVAVAVAAAGLAISTFMDTKAAEINAL